MYISIHWNIYIYIQTSIKYVYIYIHIYNAFSLAWWCLTCSRAGMKVAQTEKMLWNAKVPDLESEYHWLEYLLRFFDFPFWTTFLQPRLATATRFTAWWRNTWAESRPGSTQKDSNIKYPLFCWPHRQVLTSSTNWEQSGSKIGSASGWIPFFEVAEVEFYSSAGCILKISLSLKFY